MTDIEVLEREMECVRRKAENNCDECGNCDLLMDDRRILTAYARAISALRAKKKPKSPCAACGYGGKYLDAPPCTSCPAHPKEPEKNEPLTLEELKEMDGQPVWAEEPDGYKQYSRWVLVDCAWKSKGLIYLHSWPGQITLEAFLLKGGKIYHRPPERSTE